jgi:hypothetical protein
MTEHEAVIRWQVTVAMARVALDNVNAAFRALRARQQELVVWYEHLPEEERDSTLGLTIEGLAALDFSPLEHAELDLAEGTWLRPSTPA